MFVIKKWLMMMNLDPVWQNSVKNANSYQELEEIAQPVVSEIGWLHLEELAHLIHNFGDGLDENREPKKGFDLTIEQAIEHAKSTEFLTDVRV